MNKLIGITMLFLAFFGGGEFILSQTRNPVLEFTSATWCGACPCGDRVIEDTIKPAFPNAIFLSYHGTPNSSDPFSNFQGNEIIDSLGFIGYPTGIVDRMSPPKTRHEWYSRIDQSAQIPPTVTIDSQLLYDELRRQVFMRFTITPLVELTGEFYLYAVIIEDGIVFPQSGDASSGCNGGDDYVHNNVVRGVINGVKGVPLNSGSVWGVSSPIQKEFLYDIQPEVAAENSRIAAIVYRAGGALNLSEIQQAEEWAVIDSNVPVELTSFTAEICNEDVCLRWETATETNNLGFEIQRRIDRNNSNESRQFEKIGFVDGVCNSTRSQSYTFKDSPDFSGRDLTIFYRLKQIDLSGESQFSNVLSVQCDGLRDYRLDQNFPNPFNPSTTISYFLPKDGFTTIKLFDILGNESELLVKEFVRAGKHSIQINADNINRKKLSSGIYFYSINVNDFYQVKKMTYLK